jgi:hypothetical protein
MQESTTESVNARWETIIFCYHHEKIHEIPKKNHETKAKASRKSTKTIKIPNL